MEVQEKPKFTQRTKSFLKEVEIETKKVTWPSKGELYGSTAVVITVTVVLSAMLGVADGALAKVIQMMLSL